MDSLLNSFVFLYSLSPLFGFVHAIIGTVFPFTPFFLAHIIRLDISEGQYRPSCLVAGTSCVKIQTRTAMRRGFWGAMISQKHTTSFESRVTYKQQSQPSRALCGLIVAISSLSTGRSPFPPNVSGQSGFSDIRMWGEDWHTINNDTNTFLQAHASFRH